MSESTQSTDSKKAKTKTGTWMWHTALKRPVMFVDVVEYSGDPVVAVPTFAMETSAPGVEEETSRVINLPTKWKHLAEIMINPNELDF